MSVKKNRSVREVEIWAKFELSKKRKTKMPKKILMAENACFNKRIATPGKTAAFN